MKWRREAARPGRKQYFACTPLSRLVLQSQSALHDIDSPRLPVPAGAGSLSTISITTASTRRLHTLRHTAPNQLGRHVPLFVHQVRPLLLSLLGASPAGQHRRTVAHHICGRPGGAPTSAAPLAPPFWLTLGPTKEAQLIPATISPAVRSSALHALYLSHFGAGLQPLLTAVQGKF